MSDTADDLELAARLLRERQCSPDELADALHAAATLRTDSGAPSTLAQVLADRGLDERTHVVGRRPRPADRLGDYAIVDTLGAGGMGEVLAVQDARLERVLAAKVARNLTDARQRQAFVREARITGQLEHPGIPPVHALEDGPTPFFTMKRVQGTDLSEVVEELRRGRGPSVVRRLQIFERVCEAIAFAHSRGVLHRDLKPANVMVGEFGEVLVMDWGLAKRAGTPDHPASTGAPSDATTDPMATADGSVLGTPAYMSPEQADGRISDLDERSDVFSLGAILYELLTFEPPYDGKTMLIVLSKAADGKVVPPRVRAPGAQIPWELEALVMRAMAPDPADRYQDATALRDDVQRFLEGGLLTAARYGAGQRLAKFARRHRVAIAAAAAMLVVVGIALSARRAVVMRQVPVLLAQSADAAKAGQLRAAVAHLDEVLRIAPGNATALERRGALRQETSRRAVADARRREADRARTAAARRLAKAPTIEQLEAAWKTHRAEAASEGGERPPSSELLAMQRAALAAGLAAAGDLDRALMLAPTDAKARAARRDAALRLARVAQLGGEMTLARQAIRDLARAGVPTDEVDRRLAELDRAAEALLDQRDRRVAQILDDIGKGLDRPDRSPSAPRLRDYVFEVARYRHPRTIAAIARVLDPLSKEIADSEDRSRITPQQRDLVRFTSRVLGHLAMAESVPLLARMLEILKSTDLQREVAFALVDTRRPEVVEILMRARTLWGEDSPQWEVVEPLIRRLPAPPERTGPTSDRETLRRVELLVYRNQLDRANRLLAPLIERKVPGALYLKGRLLRVDWLGSGNKHALFEAVDYLRAAADAPGPHQPEALYFLGLSFGNMDKVPEAMAAYDRLAALAPRDDRGHWRRAELLIGLRRFDEARAALDRALALRTDRWKSWQLRGVLRYRLGDIKGAIEDHDKAVAADPTGARALYFRAKLRAALEQYREALVDLAAAIERRPQSPDLYYERAVIFHRLNKHVEALTDCEQATHLNPRHSAAHELTARLLHNARRFEAAERACDDAIRTAVTLPLGAITLRIDLYLLRGALAEAEADLRDAVKVHGDHPSVVLRAATIDLKRGRVKEAIARIGTALARGPVEGAAGHHLRAAALAAAGDMDGAAKDLERAIQLAPDDLSIHHTRAKLLHLRNRYEAAEQACTALLARAPRMFDVHILRARIRCDLGKYQAAMNDAAIAERSSGTRQLTLDALTVAAHIASATNDSSSLTQIVTKAVNTAGAKHPRTRIIRAMLLEQRNSLSAASRELGLALQEQQDLVDGYLVLTRILVAQKKGRLARTMAHAGLNRARERWDHWMGMARAQLVSGDTVRAKAAAEHALARAPANHKKAIETFLAQFR